MNAWIDARLESSGSLPAVVGLLFLGGLIASLLPCVYPLYLVTDEMLLFLNN